jgi:hypothetical protein
MANTTLYTTADAFVAEVNPDTNYGDYAMLIARSDSDGNTRSFLKFDLSGLPEDVTISSATLRLECYSVDNLSSPDTDVQARRVSDDTWTEAGIKWSNQPTPGAVEDTQTCSVTTIEWDVTSWVQNEYAGDQTASFCLRMVTEDYSSAGSQVNFRSRDYNGDDPELYIEYTTGVSIPVARHHYGHTIEKIIRG